MFSVHCGTGGAACAPLWTTTLPGESDEDEAPTVADGVVYVPHGSFDHSFLYAFPATCSTGCKPLWRGIDAFSATCATGGRTCSPLWHGSDLVASDPAVAGGEVWATVGPPTGPDKLYAFGLPVPTR